MRTTSVVVVVATSRPSRLARSWESAFSPTDELTNISFADTFSVAAKSVATLTERGSRPGPTAETPISRALTGHARNASW